MEPHTIKGAHSVPVALGDRSYDIIIGTGLLGQAQDLIAPHLAGRKVLVVSDDTVSGLYRQRLNLDGFDAAYVTVADGEGSKSFATLQTVLDAMFTHGLDRNDTVIALGGGIVGDLTGFAASIYKRGCRFIQIPTTLLAQVDSAVGGKTAINVAQGKNLVGAFYQPQLVIADMDVLSTLPQRQIKAGYAEVLKYGLLGDAGFFDWLVDHGAKILAGDTDTIAIAVKKSCEAKARIVSDDERERGARALLNLGHTFAHALETQSARLGGDLLHGEAVSVGMDIAFGYSVASGLCPSSDLARLQKHNTALGMMQAQDVAELLRDPHSLLSVMDQDKKNEDGQITLILVRGIGKAFVQKHSHRETVGNYLHILAMDHADKNPSQSPHAANDETAHA